MVFAYSALDNLKIIAVEGLADQVSYPNTNVLRQNLIAVFGTPYPMDFQIIDRVAARPVALLAHETQFTKSLGLKPIASTSGWNSESSIIRHLEDYRRTDKLKPENGGSASFLNDEQTQQLVEHLSERTYAHTHQIVAYISNRWGINSTVSGLNKWLHPHGFTYKKPKGVPHKADAEQQA
jgi:transposase